jgi:serine acetyltransferase
MSRMPSLRGIRQRLAARLVHAAWQRIRVAGTITAQTDAGRRFAAFGPGSLIAFPTGTVFGERWIEIGDGTMIAEQVSVCAGMMPGHDLGSGSVLRIGDRCVIGRGSHIVAHHCIDIGDDVFTGPYVYITDQNHSYADPDLPIGRQWPVNAAVRIGSGTWLGTGAIVLPGAVIGRNVVVAAGSVVTGRVDDRCVVAGVPARVIKDFSPDSGWTRRGAASLRADAAFHEATANDPRLAELLLAPIPAAPAVVPPPAVLPAPADLVRGGGEAAADAGSLVTSALDDEGRFEEQQAADRDS